MGIKLGGFVCDGCSVFEQYQGVKSNLDLLKLMQNNEINYDDNLDNFSVNMGFKKIPGWKYYNIIKINDDWIAWVKSKSICLCSDCDRKYKLSEIISKIKRHD